MVEEGVVVRGSSSIKPVCPLRWPRIRRRCGLTCSRIRTPLGRNAGCNRASIRGWQMHDLAGTPDLPSRPLVAVIKCRPCRPPLVPCRCEASGLLAALVEAQSKPADRSSALEWCVAPSLLCAILTVLPIIEVCRCACACVLERLRQQAVSVT